jgi:phosphoglycolate phosphatase-like HAD superfamily hydrolase
MLKAIFLDFDGIILESVDIKGVAFRKLFEEFPDQVDEIVRYHYANGGRPPFYKFLFIYTDILKKPLSEEKFQELCQKFSDLAVEGVLKCDFVPGALEFLEKCHRQFMLFIVSGTPLPEMVDIIKARALDKYFQGVYGSPHKKNYWTKHILEEFYLEPKETLWVGDALSDYEAAREHRIQFVGRVYGPTNIFADKNIDYSISTMTDMNKIIEDLK